MTAALAGALSVSTAGQTGTRHLPFLPRVTPAGQKLYFSRFRRTFHQKYVIFDDMYRRICILVLTLLAAQSVCFARTVNPGMRAPDRVSPADSPRQPEHGDLEAQPAPLRQHTIQNQPPRSSAHALQDALRQTRTRYDDERARIGRKQAAGTLRRENRRRHHHRAHDAVRLMRQLVRARRQQNPHADPRTGYPARPAVQAGRQVRSPAGRAQQATAAFAPLHLRYRGDRRTRLARFDAREHGHPRARQLDDQHRRRHTRRRAHHGRAFRTPTFSARATP